MKIDIVKINPEGDGVTAVYFDGDLFTYGDYYHNKIDDWLRGFLEGLEYVNFKFTQDNWEISGDTRIGRDVCEMGHSPPDKLSEYPKSRLKKA